MQLAIALAEKFNGEIINGDALQLYDGLPVTTNKVPIEDRRGINHHLLGCIGLGEPTWTVGNFTKEATEAMEDIYARKKLPILVGGTHYYTQALLLSDQTIHSVGKDRNLDAEALDDHWPILNKSGPEMLEALERVDPAMAKRWHPCDTRRIRRSLEIYYQTGTRASDIYLEQRNKAQNGSTSYTSLRNDALVFWTFAESHVLNERTSDRLDRMLQGSLLSEVQHMYNYYRARENEAKAPDRTRGIWVAIGYKEFEEYIQALEEGQCDEVLERLKRDAIERAKIATRQYAKSQVRWIRMKLLPAFRAALAQDRFFLLDGTDLETWSHNVVETACAITEPFLANSELPDPMNVSSMANTVLSEQAFNKPVVNETRFCTQCNTTCTTDQSWEQHIKSKKHGHASRRPIERLAKD